MEIVPQHYGLPYINQRVCGRHKTVAQGLQDSLINRSMCWVSILNPYYAEDPIHQTHQKPFKFSYWKHFSHTQHMKCSVLYPCTKKISGDYAMAWAFLLCMISVLVTAFPVWSDTVIMECNKHPEVMATGQLADTCLTYFSELIVSA
jgi:hypothetical protein